MFEWTLMKRLIWIKAAVISGAASLYETVTGAIVSFVALHAKALKKLVVNIEPVQDLHGYDAPWPPGGGVNKFDGEFRQGSSINLADTTRIAGKKLIPVIAGKTYSFSASDYTSFNYVLNSSITGELPFPAASYSQCGTPSAWSNSAITFTATNDGYAVIVVRNPDNSAIAPSDVSAVNMQFEEGAPTSYSPYANECPITGWTGVKAWATGKNLLPPERIISADAHAICLTGGETYSSSDITSYIYLKAGIYTISYGDTLRGSLFLNVYGGSETNFGQATSKTFTVLADSYIRLRIYNGSYTFTDESVVWAQLETGPTASAYEAYSGQEIDVAFPAEAGTVYGGTDEVIGGNLKKTLKGVDLSTLAWSLISSTYGRWSASVPGIKSPPDGATPLNGLAEKYRIVTSNAYNNIVGTMFCVPNGTTVNICNGSSTDTPSGTLVYEAAEPQQFTHEGQEISTQVGTNTIWADAGDVEVTYYAK